MTTPRQSLWAVAPEDRPRERLERLGPTGLTEAELVALVLGSGMPGVNVLDSARSLLDQAGGVTELMTMTVGELKALMGVGVATAGRVVAVAELWRRANDPPPGPVLETPHHIAAAVRAHLTARASTPSPTRPPASSPPPAQPPAEMQHSASSTVGMQRTGQPTVGMQRTMQPTNAEPTIGMPRTAQPPVVGRATSASTPSSVSASSASATPPLALPPDAASTSHSGTEALAPDPVGTDALATEAETPAAAPGGGSMFVVVADGELRLRVVVPLPDAQSLVAAVLHEVLYRGGSAFALVVCSSGHPEPDDDLRATRDVLKLAAATVGLRYLSTVILTPSAWTTLD